MKIKFGPVAKFGSLPGDSVKGIIMKEVVSLIDKVVRKKQADRSQGLNILLDFLIGMFDVKLHQKKHGWIDAVQKANEEEPELTKIMLIWMDKVNKEMEKGKWLDFFGELYEELYKSRGKASALGQFFTPPHVCDLMSNLEFTCRGTIGDSACGSGRMLLAQASISNFSRDNFYIGEDLDLVSVKMCALNLMLHGCRGVVRQHDALTDPNTFSYGFRINDIRYPIPHPLYSLTKLPFMKRR